MGNSNSLLLGMVAETPIHVGIGQAAAALDQPVAREQTTHFPHVPGSGVKGAWAVKLTNGKREGASEEIRKFLGNASGSADDGNSEEAGKLLFGEARLALLPIRCTSDSFKLVTCPLIAKRLMRDLKRSQGLTVEADYDGPAQGSYLGQKADGSDWLGLEEREFERKDDFPAEVAGWFKKLMGDAKPDDIDAKMVMISDADFRWFAEFGLPVAMRNALDENKTVRTGALWAEETLAPDTVMWTVISERVPGQVEAFKNLLSTPDFIQMGGNETIGQGWFSVWQA